MEIPQFNDSIWDVIGLLIRQLKSNHSNNSCIGTSLLIGIHTEATALRQGEGEVIIPCSIQYIHRTCHWGLFRATSSHSIDLLNDLPSHLRCQRTTLWLIRDYLPMDTEVYSMSGNDKYVGAILFDCCYEYLICCIHKKSPFPKNKPSPSIPSQPL